MKHIERVIKRGLKPKTSRGKRCDHMEAFAVTIFEDYVRETAYLILNCPECGKDILLTGSFVGIE
jgi:hypothetical protein